MNEDDLLKSLIGKTKEEGSELCKNAGYDVRIVRVDSIRYIITMDLRFDRVNFELDNNLITKCGIY